MAFLFEANNPQGTRKDMAARLNKLHTEDIRLKIKASQLINVLQDHALSADSELSLTRMKAIEILLRKSVPDLSAVVLSGDKDAPVKLEFTWKQNA